jgi:Cof subfamily protein (haloacid dehalogenase superfamily)
MREISLVAFDLDGTLLDSRKRIRPDARAAITRMQEAGVFVTLVTGRNYASTAPYARELQLQTPFGLVHGALVRDLLGLEILKRAIPAAGVLEAVDLAAQLDCAAMVVGIHGENNLTFCEEDRSHPAVRYVIGTEGAENQTVSAETQFVPRAEARLDAYVVYVMGRKEHIDTYLASVHSQEVRLFNAERYPVHGGGDEQITRDFAVAMLTPMGADKANALGVIAETLGVGMESVLAFGDWHNDRTMLEAAGHAVLMGNAPDNLAELIKHPHLFRTGHNDETGVVDGLRRFGLL